MVELKIKKEKSNSEEAKPTKEKSKVNKNLQRKLRKEVNGLRKRLRKLTTPDEKKLRKDLKMIIDVEGELRYLMKRAIKKERKDEEERFRKLLVPKIKEENGLHDSLRKASPTDKAPIREQLIKLTTK